MLHRSISMPIAVLALSIFIASLLHPFSAADLSANVYAQEGGPLREENPTLGDDSQRPLNSQSADDTTAPRSQPTFDFRLDANRIAFFENGKPAGEYVFRDEMILRPYFANLRAPNGELVTRHHPPRPDVDANDHATMHPGLWLAFGDIRGTDFWRNQGTIEHLRFTEEPQSRGDQLTFATESRLVSQSEGELGTMLSDIQVIKRPLGWLIIWHVSFQSQEHTLTFGDQEEMGFGARVATPLTELNGGRILSSTGSKTAAKTWGQPALWCDYSGTLGAGETGITLMTAPRNFRGSWWHNRNYGLTVANPFGRAAMRQGSVSTVTVKRGERFGIGFAAMLHGGEGYDPGLAYQDYLKLLKSTPTE